MGAEVRVTMKGVQETIKSLNDLEKEQLPFAISKAMNDTAWSVRDALMLELQMKLHMVTEWMRNSPKYLKSTKRNLKVLFYYEGAGKGGTDKGVADEIVNRHMVGGTRRDNRLERWLRRKGTIPSGHQLVTADPYRDANGNMKGSDAMRILSGLQAAPDSYQNRTARSEERNRTLQEFFVIRVGQRSHLKPGIYRRSGTHGVIVTPVAIIVRNPIYKGGRLNPMEVVRATWEKVFPRKFEAALKRAIETARKK